MYRVAAIRQDHCGIAISRLESISVAQLVCGGSARRMTLGSKLPAFYRQ